MRKMRSTLVVAVSLALLSGLGGVAAAQQEEGEPMNSGSEPWDLVWFSDSLGFDVADLWAARIEEELGVEVRVHDYARPTLRAVEILPSLDPSIDGFSRLGDTRDEVAEAEIIVVFGVPTPGVDGDFESCVSTSTVPRDPPTRYASEDLAPYRDVLVSIYERVFELVGDRPVIVRTIDWPNTLISDWPLAGVEEECTAGWEAWSDSLADAAAGFDVEMVSMYDWFNGPDHTEDPRAKGYVGLDGFHPSAAGSEAMVAALHEAGYEPLRP